MSCDYAMLPEELHFGMTDVTTRLKEIIEHDRWLIARQKLETRCATGNDDINHPPHYTQHPSGVECIQITEHCNFCIGNAIKYLWRSGKKDSEIKDLKKAIWYINREIDRIGRGK